MLEVDTAVQILKSHADLARYRDEGRSTHVLMFEARRTANQLAVWLRLPRGKTAGSGVRIKVEKYEWNIPGIEPIECAKSDNLNNKPGSRIKNGQGKCVFVASSQSLHALIAHINGIASDDEPAEKPQEGASSNNSESVVNQPKDDDIASRKEVSIRERSGQLQFRKNMLALYGNMCAVTECGVAEVLEAAHIFDHALSGINNSENGLLLRSDIHLLFDQNLIRINPDSLKIAVDEKLKDSEYWKLNGKHLKPRTDGSQPGRDYLLNRWYSETRKF